MGSRRSHRPAYLGRVVGVAVTAAALLAPALADPVAVDRRITHPDGATLLLKTIEFRAASIAVSATITNPSNREISLDRARSFVLDDGARGVYRLNPPLENPELRIPPHAQVAAELVFVGPLAPGTRQLTLSANAGVGTANNPFDAAPSLRATFPVEAPAETGRRQANHPNGAVLWVDRLVAGPGGCIARLHAANGNDRTIVLNQARSLVVSDDRGHSAPVDPPAENAELVVPPGDRLDAALAFDCHVLDDAGTWTLSTNRGTAGTPDNPYETLPVFSLSLPPRQPASEAAATTSASSQATAAPLPRSRLEAPEPVTAATSPQTPQPQSPPPASSAERPEVPSPAKPPVAAAATANRIPKTIPQLEAALHAKRDDRGLHILLSTDMLFGAAPATLDSAAETALQEVAALIAAAHPHLVVVSGHTDSTGNDDDNLALSKQRAHAVAAWIEAQTAKARPPPRFAERSYGRTRPIAPNHKSDGSDNPEGRAQNRRVEVTLH